MRTAFAFCAGPAALGGMAPPFMLPRDKPRNVPGPTKATARADLPPAAVWMVLARRALAAGDAKGALRCFDGAIACEPDLAMAHLGRAVCLSELGDDPASDHALQHAMASARGQEEVLYSLARMCATQGQTTLAIPLLTEAVRAVPALEHKAMQDRLFADHPAYLMALGRL